MKPFMSSNDRDSRIQNIQALLPPVALLERYPATEKSKQTVRTARQTIHRMIHGDDKRLLVIIGPCSIHDSQAALEYAKRLLPLRQKYRDRLEIIMRVYFEKPRTSTGWKGLLNDPNLDGSFDINQGLRIGRKLLLDLTQMGMPSAVEFLDMISPQYLADLISWGAIGARTTESQLHRELASGMPCPVGFKNGTNGNVQIAIDAVNSAKSPHHFLSINPLGHSAIISTTGNKDSHIILRGGDVPNYDQSAILAVEKRLKAAKLPPKILVDCSHANSQKQFKNQLLVAKDIIRQRQAGNQSIFGLMIESHLIEGNQKESSTTPLTYGQSITDACIGWQDSEKILDYLAKNNQRLESL